MSESVIPSPEQVYGSLGQLEERPVHVHEAHYMEGLNGECGYSSDCLLVATESGIRIFTASVSGTFKKRVAVRAGPAYTYREMRRLRAGGPLHPFGFDCDPITIICTPAAGDTPEWQDLIAFLAARVNQEQ